MFINHVIKNIVDVILGQSSALSSNILDRRLEKFPPLTGFMSVALQIS